MALAHPATFDFRSGIPETSLFPHRPWQRLIAGTLRAESFAKTNYGDSTVFTQRVSSVWMTDWTGCESENWLYRQSFQLSYAEPAT